jgi:outer membrane lipoprotein LolB
VAVINVTPASATLKESGKQPLTAPDLDTLTQKTLGWTLPVSGLRDWLQGYATDSEGKRFVASPANDNVITRDGWKLEYMSWQDDNAPCRSPSASTSPASRWGRRWTTWQSASSSIPPPVKCRA